MLGGSAGDGDGSAARERPAVEIASVRPARKAPSLSFISHPSRQDPGTPFDGLAPGRDLLSHPRPVVQHPNPSPVTSIDRESWKLNGPSGVTPLAWTAIPACPEQAPPSNRPEPPMSRARLAIVPMVFSLILSRSWADEPV